MRLGYRTAVQILFIALLVATVMVVASSGYYQARTGVVSLSDHAINAALEQIAERSLEIVHTAEQHLALMALVISKHDPISTPESSLQLLWQFNQQSNLYQSAFYSDLQGNFLQNRRHPNPATRVIKQDTDAGTEHWIYRERDFNPLAHVQRNAEYDPRQQTWFQTVTTTEALHVSEITPLSSTDALGIVIAYPVHDAEGELRGIVGFTLGLAQLNEFVSRQLLAEDTILVIIDTDDRVIAYPHGQFPSMGASMERTELFRSDALKETWVHEAWQAVRPNAGHAAPTTVQLLNLSNGAYFVHSKPASSKFTHEWYLLLLIPEYIILSSVNQGLYSSIMLAIIMQIVAAYLIFVTASQLTRPLKEMVANANLLAQLRFRELKPVSSGFAEFQTLDHSIQRMKTSLLAFNRYVPTALVRRLLSEQQEVKLGGESKAMVIFNTGINGFSSKGRTLAAPDQADYLTRYQKEVFEAVRRNGGSIDKFIDDRIIGFWGAPDTDGHDVYNSCRAAIESQKAIVQLNHILRREGYPLLNVRIGLHTDLCVVGNFGAEDRMFYSVIGTAISVSYWLCNLNKRYGTNIIASEEIRNQVSGDFAWRWLDQVILYDQKTIINLYELIGFIDEGDIVQREEYINRYEHALSLKLHDGSQQKALKAFRALQRIYTNDESIAWQIHALSEEGLEDRHELF